MPPPRILVVVPGHGEPHRSWVTMGNLARLATMRIVTTCWMFVYGIKMSDELLTARFPQCTFTRQSGLWMHHLRALPLPVVHRHEYVFVMIDGVELNSDVDLFVLTRVMRANHLSLAGPACGSCKSKMLIHPVRETRGIGMQRRLRAATPRPLPHVTCSIPAACHVSGANERRRPTRGVHRPSGAHVHGGEL